MLGPAAALFWAAFACSAALCACLAGTARVGGHTPLPVLLQRTPPNERQGGKQHTRQLVPISLEDRTRNGSAANLADKA